MLLQSFDFHSNTVQGFLDEDSKPWICLKDICDILDIRNHRDVASRLDDDEKRVSATATPGGEQKKLFVNESGVYAVIFTSNKPNAKAFRKWVTDEVLPSIRTTGSYEIPSSKQMLLFPLRDNTLQRNANHQRNKSVGKKKGTNAVITMWRDVLHKELYPDGLKEEAMKRAIRDGLDKRTLMSYQDIFRKYPDLHGYAITSAFVNKMVEDKSLGVSIDEKTAIRWAKQMQATALEIGEHFCTNPAITPDGTQSELSLN